MCARRGLNGPARVFLARAVLDKGYVVVKGAVSKAIAADISAAAWRARGLLTQGGHGGPRGPPGLAIS